MNTRNKKQNDVISAPAIAGSNSIVDTDLFNTGLIRTSNSKKRAPSISIKIPIEPHFQKEPDIHLDEIVNTLPAEKRNSISAQLDFYLLINAIEMANSKEIKRIAFAHPGLSILKFNITTTTGYIKISAFQLALLMMDFKTANTLLAGAATLRNPVLFLKKLENEYNELLQFIESGDSPIINLIRKIDEYINHYEERSFKDNEKFWCHNVGDEMRKIPFSVLKSYYCKSTDENEINPVFYVSSSDKKAALIDDYSELHPQIGVNSALVRGNGPYARTSKNPLASAHAALLMDDLKYLKNRHHNYINAINHFAENFHFIISKVENRKHTGSHEKPKSDISSSELLQQFRRFKQLSGYMLFSSTVEKNASVSQLSLKLKK